MTRRTRRVLAWRAALAAGGNLAMMTGLYPFLPHAMRRKGRRAAGHADEPSRVGAEFLLGWAASTARPLGLLAMRRPIWSGARGPRPIVLIHGYAMSRACFLLLAARLGRAGLGPLYGFEYWSLGTVASAARRLGEYIDELCEKNGADGVDLVGHSMGGVVGRYHVTLGGGSPRVKHLVTIGSPHRGTELSHFGFGRPVRELLPGSPLVTRLDAARLPATTRALCVWSRGDALVWSERQASFPGAREISFEDLGHLGMLASRRVARAIAEFLGPTAAIQDSDLLRER